MKGSQTKQKTQILVRQEKVLTIASQLSMVSEVKKTEEKEGKFSAIVILLDKYLTISDDDMRKLISPAIFVAMQISKDKKTIKFIYSLESSESTR